jgi:succinyl-diaminopimelate desuccinylase
MQTTDRDLACLLANRTLALVSIPSVSRDEAALHEHVLAAASKLKRFRLTDVPGQGLFLEPSRRSEGKPFVVLAGHLDTVPEQGNLPGRIDGDTLHGLGASDMKCALAVMMELAEWLDREQPPAALDLGFLYFAREELPINDSAVPSMFAACPRLRQADLVIVMEPTDGALQIGCLGNLNAELTFDGKSAHSARPWQGDNALHKAIAGLQTLAAVEAKPVEIGGLTFTEVLSLTKIQGGIAGNVIPDRVTCHLNYRYAPNRSAEEAEAKLRELAPAKASLQILGNAVPARAAVDNPLITALRELGNLPVEPKQAWTPVAEFSAEGLDAVNFGPGLGRYAHQRDEQVRIPDVVHAFELLQKFTLGADFKSPQAPAGLCS